MGVIFMAKIAKQIDVFLTRGTRPTEHQPKKKIGTYIFAQSDLKRISAQSHGRLLR